MDEFPYAKENLKAMESWRIELKPGSSCFFRLVNQIKERRILHITATLCEGEGKEKSVIQYSIGDNKSPVDLCALFPNENKPFSLSLELGCDDNSVEFSVTGDRCIILTGFVQTESPNQIESDIWGRVPPREEYYRLWSTLSMKELEETMKNYLNV